jgi:nicotinate-nucleotide pyrophosphorylase (carboxylating)
MPVTERQVEAWLDEDLGHHDVTNQVPGRTEGLLVAKEPGVAAGLEAATAVFEYLDCEVTRYAEAGDRIDAGATLISVEGPAKSVLRGERVAVNLAGHAAGIATETWSAVEAATDANPDVAVAATRKTTPGLRGVEKRAVAAGGGDTHRLDLSHLVMVKDNHVAEMGLREAVEHFHEEKSFVTRLEVEVESPDQAETAVAAGADAVLFDNMPPEEVAVGVAGVPDSTLTEASGGITHSDVRAYARTGVDVISMGWLTHSARSLDLSFRTG